MGADFESLQCHVPFCLRRCGYCDFNTYTASDLGAGASRADYARMAVREMDWSTTGRSAHGIAEPPPRPCSSAAARRRSCRRRPDRHGGRHPCGVGCRAGAEITTEANPDTVDETTSTRAGRRRVHAHLVRHAIGGAARAEDAGPHPHAGARGAPVCAPHRRPGLRERRPDLWRAGGGPERLAHERAHGDRPGCEPHVRVRADRGADDDDGPADRRRHAAETGRRRRGGEIRDRRRQLAPAAGLQWYEILQLVRPRVREPPQPGVLVQCGLGRHRPGRALTTTASSPHQSRRVGTLRPAGESSLHRTPMAPSVPAIWPTRGWEQQSQRRTGAVGRHESIDAAWTTLEETIMLGLRLREGLDVMALRTSRISAAPAPTSTGRRCTGPATGSVT